jgi:hypothetical protein
MRQYKCRFGGRGYRATRDLPSTVYWQRMKDQMADRVDAIREGNYKKPKNYHHDWK